MNCKKTIVIAGGGTAGWISASTLSYALNNSVNIILVESDDIPTVGVGEATIPPIILLHQVLGLNEREVLAKVGGTFKLGIQFENWSKIGKKYIHSFGSAGKDNWACRFIHYWLRGKEIGINREYGDYCLEHLAARENKFLITQGGLKKYAYHLDAALYAKLLREYSEKNGVIRKEGKITQVKICAESGGIKALILASGESIEGDFFVDCTGFRSLLLGEALKERFIDWSNWLPCDRAIAMQTSVSEEPIPYTRAIAHENGWQWRIPLQHRSGNGYVYCSQFQSDDKAKSLLISNAKGEPINEPKPFKFKAGTRDRHWVKNCVAIGLSSSFLEPLESTSIHLIQQGATLLAKLFSNGEINQDLAYYYNNRVRAELTDIRDFIILHYCMTERNDSEFWRYCCSMDIPESLSNKIALFSEHALVFKESYELFAEESWAQVIMGQGELPAAYHTAAKGLSEDELRSFLERTANNIRDQVKKMPSHQEFINYYCKAK